jgi:hypothetical protein
MLSDEEYSPVQPARAKAMALPPAPANASSTCGGPCASAPSSSSSSCAGALPLPLPMSRGARCARPARKRCAMRTAIASGVTLYQLCASSMMPPPSPSPSAPSPSASSSCAKREKSEWRAFQSGTGQAGVSTHARTHAATRLENDRGAAGNERQRERVASAAGRAWEGSRGRDGRAGNQGTQMAPRAQHTSALRAEHSKCAESTARPAE